ncbi:MAG: DUF3365 domain-containing protein [Pirellulaceae bacterium]
MSAISAEEAKPAAPPTAKPDSKPDEAAVARTRKTVQMLDNIYKQTIVLITDKYVHSEDDFPAGSAAVLLFRNITASGSHEVRLIDATGSPYEAKNVAQDAFEKEGLKKLKSGEAYYEQVVEKDGKARLRALTPVPVVMQKCVMCHPHYADAKKGEPIGAISYSMPIE